MKIVYSNRLLNFKKELEPLFEAMKNGQRIKSVRCFKGIRFKENNSHDFFIKNFVAVLYWNSFAKNANGESLDYVETDSEISFFMNYVRSFEIS